MIALLLEDRCTGCNTCIDVCPTLVFDAAPTYAKVSAPVIARVDACQTCYLCELYCPVDALYVAPNQFTPEQVTAEAVLASGQLGRLRQDSGWGNDGAGADLEVYRLLGPLLNQGAEIATVRAAKLDRLGAP